MNSYQKITDRIIADMQDAIKWEKPWLDNFNAGYNALSGKSYNGVNALITMGKGGFLTFKQASSLGGSVIKGSKGTPILFFSILEKEDKAGEKTTIPMAKINYVFGLDQIEKLDVDKLKLKEQFLNVDYKQCDVLLQQNDVSIIHGGNKAAYNPTDDVIKIPVQGAFNSEADYYATLLHELVHWTGHESRCNRAIKNQYGTPEYAFEELVAELGAAMLCSEVGITYTQQHAAYIANWIKLLQEDSKAIFKAAKLAEKAVKLLLNKEEEKKEKVA